MCGATLKPLHLHNPSTSVGNMEVVDRLEKFDLMYFYNMTRTCPWPSWQALITYSCPLTCFDVGSGSSGDHASGQQSTHIFLYGGVNCWRLGVCWLHLLLWWKSVGQLLPNNTVPPWFILRRVHCFASYSLRSVLHSPFLQNFFLHLEFKQKKMVPFLSFTSSYSLSFSKLFNKLGQNIFYDETKTLN